MFCEKKIFLRDVCFLSFMEMILLPMNGKLRFSIDPGKRTLKLSHVTFMIMAHSNVDNPGYYYTQFTES